MFGYTVLSLTYDPAEASLPEAEGITGGGGLYGERDMSPPNPSGEEPWGNQFGF